MFIQRERLNTLIPNAGHTVTTIVLTIYTNEFFVGTINVIGRSGPIEQYDWSACYQGEGKFVVSGQGGRLPGGLRIPNKEDYPFSHEPIVNNGLRIIISEWLNKNFRDHLVRVEADRQKAASEPPATPLTPSSPPLSPPPPPTRKKLKLIADIGLIKFADKFMAKKPTRLAIAKAMRAKSKENYSFDAIFRAFEIGRLSGYDLMSLLKLNPKLQKIFDVHKNGHYLEMSIRCARVLTSVPADKQVRVWNKVKALKLKNSCSVLGALTKLCKKKR